MYKSKYHILTYTKRIYYRIYVLYMYNLTYIRHLYAIFANNNLKIIVYINVALNEYCSKIRKNKV